MKNENVMTEKPSKEEIKKKNSKDLNKRAEIEKELNIQRNLKNKNKGPHLSDMKMNQLNYYNEIAKNNIHNLMNNPTLKDIIRITSNESVFDQLKAKEQSKDLSKFLDIFPLKRVERINYKCLEIGQMRKDLGVLKNPEVNYNKEVCRKLAGNLFEKRKREGSANYYIPVLTTDNIKIYNQNNKKKFNQSHKKNNLHKNNLAVSNDETWLKKYKHKTHNHNIKKEKINENNRYNNQTEDIKYNKDNANLESARIEVNKYKNNFDFEDNLINKKDKEINEIKTSVNTESNNKYNDLNESNDYKFPKRTLTTNFSNKIRMQNQNDYEKNNELFEDKKLLTRQNFFSSNNIRKDYGKGEIKVNKKNKNLYKNKSGSNSQTRIRTNGIIS